MLKSILGGLEHRFKLSLQLRLIIIMIALKPSHFQDHQTHQSSSSVVSLKRTSHLAGSADINCLRAGYEFFLLFEQFLTIPTLYC